MEYKILEEQDLELMEDVLKDDNMIFNATYLNIIMKKVITNGYS